MLLSTTVVTNASGTACVAGLIVGDTYTITETGAPAGYDTSAVAPQDAVAAARRVWRCRNTHRCVVHQ